MMKPSLPPILPDDPGQVCDFNIDFQREEERWQEHINLATLLAHALREQGFAADADKEYVALPSGWILQPRIVDFEMNDDGTGSTSTTIQVSHPTLSPLGVFEYQHSIGDSAEEAFASGFKNWVATDVPALLDGTKDQKEEFNAMIITYPAKDGSAEFRRRIVFGPPQHRAHKHIDYGEHHPFCPCCLFTNSMDAFEKLLKKDEFVAIRLFASRNTAGEALSDCRVNGVDWPDGAEALLKYVQNWPDRGLETRKQYVTIRTVSEGE